MLVLIIVNYSFKCSLLIISAKEISHTNYKTPSFNNNNKERTQGEIMYNNHQEPRENAHMPNRSYSTPNIGINISQQKI